MTPDQGKYLILDFNFTGVEKQIGLVQDSFIVFRGGDRVLCEAV